MPRPPPALHAAFLSHAVPQLAADTRLVGVAVGGSYLDGSMDEWSDLDLVIAVTDSTIRAVRAAVGNHLTEEQTVKQVTMPKFRQRFTHGDALTDDRWSDFIDGLVRGAYAEAKQGKTPH